MAENKKSFILYTDQMAIFESLTDEEAGKLVRLIYQYVNDMEPQVEDRLIKIAFEPIKQQLKRDLKEWEAKKVKKSDAGRNGGVKSGETRRTKTKQNEANEANEATLHSASLSEANEAVTVSGNDTVTVTDTVNDFIINKNSKLFEMFRRASSRKIDDDMLLQEIGKFINKYPEPEKHNAGLVNKWCGNIEIPETKKVYASKLPKESNVW